MRSGFIRVMPPDNADPEPPPEITPFPIRIVGEPAPPPVSVAGDVSPRLQDQPVTKRCDAFYQAWDKFLALEPKRAKRASTPARKLEEEKKDIEEGPTEGLQVKENAAKSWEQASADCKRKVAAIVEECKRLNQKYRDAVFDLESNQYCLQSLNGRFPKAIDIIDPPPWIKRVEDIFDDPQFYIDGATANDVHQGSGGDCWFLASLMAVSAKKELIENLCVARDEKVGVYGFVFYRDGEWIYEVIDDKLFLKVGDDDDLCVVRDWEKDKKEGMTVKHDDEKLKNQLQRGGEALYFSHCKSNETWLPLIEKAYAKAHGDYFAIEGGFASEGIEDLTGGVGVVLNPEDIMDKNRFWTEQLIQVNEKYLFGGGSKPNGSKGFVGGHAYAVLTAWEEGDLRLLKLRNPWGETEWEGDWSDGSKLWTPQMMTKLNHTFGDDGVFWISYKDFLKHFPCINRVRLFSKEWQISQQWTCVNVPWTIDYLDTKFRFSITKKGPVVIVLSQPDDRYFYGLRGRLLFALHFKVYREGEEDDRWIVRSMHNSGNETVFTRSVSAEIEDLEPGTYSVIFKVTATRSNIAGTAEECIMKYAIDRKEKLLSVGRRFDYAYTKGNLRAMEEANAKRKLGNRRGKRKEGWKMVRKLNQQEKERARKRKNRIDEAMKERRMAFHIKQRDRAERRHQRRKREREDNESTQAQADGTQADSNESAKDAVSALTPPSDTDIGAVEKSDEATNTAETKETVEEHNKSTEEPTSKPTDDTITTKLSKPESKPATEVFSTQTSRRPSSAGPPPPMHYASSSDGYESPLLPPSELDDDDFDWDSDMDGPAGPLSDDEERRPLARGENAKNEIFAEDPWNATCVLGLRVYSLNSEAKVCVVKGEEDE